MKPEEIRSVAGLIDCIASTGQPKYVLFWGHRPGRDGAITKACFSQWYEAAFNIDGFVIRLPSTT